MKKVQNMRTESIEQKKTIYSIVLNIGELFTILSKGFLLILLLNYSSNSFAVEVKLSNGNIFSGNIVSDENSYIIIDVGGSKITILKEMIIEIDGKSSNQLANEWICAKRDNTMQQYYKFLTNNCNSPYADSARMKIAEIFSQGNGNSTGVVVYSDGSKQRIEETDILKKNGIVDIIDPCSGRLLQYEYRDTLTPQFGKIRIISKKEAFRWTPPTEKDTEKLKELLKKYPDLLNHTD